MVKNFVLLLLGGFAIYGAVIIDLNVIRDNQRAAILSNVDRGALPQKILSPQNASLKGKPQEKAKQRELKVKREVAKNDRAAHVKGLSIKGETLDTSKIFVKKDPYYTR